MTAEELIPIYHSLFYVCMAGSILFAALAVFFFFMFDIRRVFNVQSGRAERMTVERMRAENAATGRLLSTAGTTEEPAQRPPTVVQPPSSEVQQTTPLAQHTTQKTIPTAGRKKAQPTPKVPAGRKFIISKKIILTHTSETI